MTRPRKLRSGPGFSLAARAVALAAVAFFALRPDSARAQELAPALDAARRGFVAEIAEADYEGATTLFADAYRRSVTPERLRAQWDRFVRENGPLIGFRREFRVEDSGGLTVCAMTADFERGSLSIKMVLQETGRIAALVVAPTDIGERGPHMDPSEGRPTIAPATLAPGPPAGQSTPPSGAEIPKSTDLADAPDISPPPEPSPAPPEPADDPGMAIELPRITPGAAGSPDATPAPATLVADAAPMIDSRPGGPTRLPGPSFVEHAFTVTSGDFTLPGTLATPRGAPPWPVVLLIPGRGASDRDETIQGSGNKPMRDIAWGLAERGIASLRYNKRTYQYRSEIDPRQLTYREEFVDDALAAIRMLRKDERVDGDAIFVLGHGLGGQVLPAILDRARTALINSSLLPASLRFESDSYIAGGIVLAGTTRPLADVLIDEMYHRYNEDGYTLEESRIISEFQASVGAMMESGDPKHPTVMGLSYNYLSALNAYDCLKVAERLKVPLFVVQGGRDFQAPPELDYQDWVAALSDRADVEFKLYEKLNHLFVEAESASSRDYMKPGTVSEEFLDDAAAWIGRRLDDR